MKSRSYPTEVRDRIQALLKAKQNYKYAHVRMGEPRVEALKIHNLQHIAPEIETKAQWETEKLSHTSKHYVVPNGEKNHCV